MKLEDLFANAFVGVVQNNRNVGIRLNPYIEIRGEEYELKTIQLDLLQLSIGCTVRGRFLRIQGIQNCKLIAPYTKHDWFKQVISLFEKGEHLNDEGRVKIMSLVPSHSKSRSKGNKLIMPGLNVQ